MADVFLSYARADAASAKRVAEALEGSGRSVWYDPDLPAHRPFADVIATELEAARSVLVLWSKSAVQSQWVRSEADRARELGKIVQCRLDNSRLPMPFDQIQCANLTNWRRGRGDIGWSQVLRSVAALVDGPAPASEAVKLGSRRPFLIGGLASAGVLAVGMGSWALSRRRHEEHIPPDIAPMMDQARAALWQNTPEGQNQSIGLYRQAVFKHPEVAEAWGGLSLAYAVAAHWRQSAESQMFYERAQSAARRALSIDARNTWGMIGLARAKPNMRNWLPIERDLRMALESSPKNSEIEVFLSEILWIVGRTRDASQYVNAQLPGGPTPGLYVRRASMLWSMGQQEELDDLLDEASKLYPTHFGVWFTRFYIEMLSGRADAALALAADLSSRPTGISPDEIDSVVRVANAIKSRVPAEVDAVIKEWMSRAREGAGYAENAAQFMAALGRPNDAFTVLRAYYFSEGFDCGENRFKGSLASFTPRGDRQTAFLFNPAIEPLRSDPRFAKLTSDLELTKYWEQSRTIPDYQSGRPS
jgi:tetratricopeptide (TPR) repeat protein